MLQHLFAKAAKKTEFRPYSYKAQVLDWMESNVGMCNVHYGLACCFRRFQEILARQKKNSDFYFMRFKASRQVKQVNGAQRPAVRHCTTRG